MRPKTKTLLTLFLLTISALAVPALTVAPAFACGDVTVACSNKAIGQSGSGVTENSATVTVSTSGLYTGDMVILMLSGEKGVTIVSAQDSLNDRVSLQMQTSGVGLDYFYQTIIGSGGEPCNNCQVTFTFGYSGTDTVFWIAVGYRTVLNYTTQTYFVSGGSGLAPTPSNITLPAGSLWVGVASSPASESVGYCAYWTASPSLSLGGGCGLSEYYYYSATGQQLVDLKCSNAASSTMDCAYFIFRAGNFGETTVTTTGVSLTTVTTTNSIGRTITTTISGTYTSTLTTSSTSCSSSCSWVDRNYWKVVALAIVALVLAVAVVYFGRRRKK